MNGAIIAARARKLAGRITALAVAFLAGLSVARAEIKVGDPFPPLAAAGVANLAGGELPAFEGRVVIVDFWASWCAPCKASFPALARLHQDYAGRGLTIAAVGIDEKPKAAEAFWKKMKPPFATLHDRRQQLVQQVVVPAMPTSYLIGRDGRVRFVHQGYHGDATDRLWRQQIETLLAERPTP